MEKKNTVSVLVVSKGKEPPKYFDLNLNYIKYGVALVAMVLFFSVTSLYYSLKVYSSDPGSIFSSNPEVHDDNFEFDRHIGGIEEPNLFENSQANSQEINKAPDDNAKHEDDENLITIVNHYSDGSVEYKTQTKEEALEEKLIEVEKQLIDMQEVLKKKGIKKDLSIGEEFLPEDRLSNDYLDVIKEDIGDLSRIFESYPIGRPSSGAVSSGFGYRRDPFHKRIAFHSGIDLDSNYGSRVVSTANGVVMRAGWCEGYGRCIVIKHRDGYKTLYGHLSVVSVQRGERVKSGQIIGKVGSTGRSTGPHLHYEVIKNGNKLNPKKYLNMG